MMRATNAEKVSNDNNAYPKDQKNTLLKLVDYKNSIRLRMALNRVLRSRIVRVTVCCLLLVPIWQYANAQQELRQAPIEGWLYQGKISPSPANTYQEDCKAAGWTPGRFEYELGSNPPISFRYWCEYTDPDSGELQEVTFSSWIVRWSAQCQTGYGSRGTYFEDARLRIGYCASIGPIQAQPEVCCETGGSNPIFISSRRKVQTEVDYRGTGNFPLVFQRIYTNGRPGRTYSSLDYPGLKVWYHHYDRRLSGDVAGSGVSGSYTRSGDYWTPEPSTIGGSAGSNFNAIRHDGTIVYINNFSSASNQRMSLVPGATLRGEPGYILTTAPNEREYYDELGRLTEIQSRWGEVHYLNYNTNNVLESVVDDYGKSLQFEYLEGRLSAIVDPEGNRISYTYNIKNDFETVTFPDTGSGSRTRTYIYDGEPRFLTGIEDERGNRYSSWSYSTVQNERGNANLSTGPSDINRVDIDRFGTSGMLVTSPLGLQTVHNYSVINGARTLTSKQRLATATTPAATESRTYNADGFLTSLTDWNGNTTTYERDGRGLPLIETLSAGTPEERNITREWDATFRVPLSEQYPDYRIDYTRDANGNVLQRSVTDSATGEVRVWSYTYDVFGKMTTVDGPRDDVTDITSYGYYTCNTGAQCGQLQSMTNALGQVTTYTDYNAHGQNTRMVSPNGLVTTRTYDARRRLISQSEDGQVTSISYDANSNVTRITLPDGTYNQFTWDVVNRLTGIADGQGNTISWDLDAAGNRTNESLLDPAGELKYAQSRLYDALSRLVDTGYSHGAHDVFGYDANGNQTQLTDGAGRIESQTYDGLDRLSSLQDAIQGITTFSYDTQDNLTSVTDPEGEVTTYGYNGFGDRLSESSPDTGVTSFTLDAAGNRITSTDARGITKTYTYDALNRPVSIAYPDATESINYEYDQGSFGVGHLTRVSDESGSTSFGYDSRGNLISSIRTIGTQSYPTTYQYNGADRLLGMTYPSGRSVAYSYDASGRVSAVDSTAPDGTSESLASAIARLPFGPMTSLTLGNGIARNRDYDQDYRIEALTDAGVLDRGYAWDAVSNITAITDSINPDASQLFTYDDLDRLDFATGSYGERSYTYDGVGNRLSLERSGSANDGTDTYQYGSAGHRLDEILGQTSYTYDAVGNTLAAGAQSFIYNQRSRLASATADGATTTYQYNALGQRVLKSSATSTTHYIYDQSGLVIAEADDSGTILVEYAYLDGQPLAMWRDSAEPELPAIPTFLLPQGSTDTATPIYSWEPLADSIRYQIIVFDRTVGEQVHNAQYVADDICTTNCAVQPEGVSLLFSTNHFWRVRARNAVGWGEWSGPILFDYVDAVVDTVTAVAPIGSSDTATPTYQWNGIDGVSEYQLIVFDRVVGSQVLNSRYLTDAVCSADPASPTGTLCGVVPEGIELNLSANHFWRIRARNSGGWGAWSDPIRFDYVEQVPGEVTPIAPIGDSDTAAPSYEWQPIANASEYEFFVHDRSIDARIYQSTFASTDICTATSCSVTPEGVSVGFATNHFWRIRARNTGGWGAWTPATRFNYVDQLPGLVTGLSPIDVTESTATPTYSWQSLSGVVDYQLIVFDRTVGGQILNQRYTAAELCDEVNSTCSLEPDGIQLTDNTNHFWRIRAFNTGGWGEWSDPLRFDVDAGAAQ